MRLSMKGIRKSFGGTVQVLNGVDFSLQGGEICALLGENGAGKSTLMNILGGVLRADAGEILLDGCPVRFSSPADSLGAGIAFIHQELNLVEDLTVAENLYLSAFPRKGIFLDRGKMREGTRAVFSRLGMEIDPDRMVRELDASYKQMVEIAGALLRDASVIIMDEPTSSLAEGEIGRIFAVMKTLRAQGVGIVFISHKLGEIMEICDRYVVLRDGSTVAEGMVADTSERALAAAMVGHEVVENSHRVGKKPGREVLRLDKLCGGKYFRDISLSVREGEILGVTGLIGDGRGEIFETVFGLRKRTGGEMYLYGEPFAVNSPKEAVDRGIAFLPRNRKQHGIIQDLSVSDNGTLTVIDKLRKWKMWIDEGKRREAFEEQRTELQIKVNDPNASIVTLSGGNQQKVVLGKWLLTRPRLLIMDNPTCGVDVGAKEEIYEIIERLADEGCAIVILSAEANEIARLCDRSVVLFHGDIVRELKGNEQTEQSILYFASGGKEEKDG